MSTPRPERSAGSGGSNGSRRALAILGAIALFGLALFLRARPIDHGMPRNYLPDTHIVRAALGMAQDKHPVPEVGTYSSYPNLLPYLLLPVYGGQFVIGSAMGEWAGQAEYKERIVEHPEEVHLLARWLIVLFGTLTPLVVFRAARAAGLEAGAWVAAYLVAVGVMGVHFSVQERPWVPMVFFTMLSAWPAARYVANPRGKTLVLSGLAAALAASCHQSGCFVLGLPGLAWLVSPLKWTGRDLASRLKQGTLCVAAFCVLALLVGYPSYVVHGWPTDEQTIGGDAADFSFAGQSINFEFSWASVPRLSSAFFGYAPVLLVLALAGLVPFLKRRAALPAGLFALGWAAFFLTHQNDHLRYLLPLSALFALPAGSFVEARLRSGGKVRWVVLAFCLVPLVLSLRLGSVLSREDARAQGEALLNELPAEALVAIDRYGPRVDLDQESLERLARLRELGGGGLYTREARRYERLAAGELTGGANALFLEDLLDTDERRGTARVREELRAAPDETVAQALARLGVTHLLVVNRLGAGLEGSLLAGEVEGRDLLSTITPFADADADAEAGGEARLPMELSFPLVSLWKLERPGPWMGLYELR